MAKVNTPDPWERQPDETPKAFEAFCVYRDLGADRSIAKAGKQLGKNRVTLEQWSTKYGWVKRCTAWDTEQDRLARIKQQQDIQKMRKRHAGIATTMLIKAATALQRIPDDEIKASDISRMVEVASKLERISRGDVGEVVEERDGGKTADPVTFYIPDNGRDKPKEEE
jgi:hypothetical protein